MTLARRSTSRQVTECSFFSPLCFNKWHWYCRLRASASPHIFADFDFGLGLWEAVAEASMCLFWHTNQTQISLQKWRLLDWFNVWLRKKETLFYKQKLQDHLKIWCCKFLLLMAFLGSRGVRALALLGDLLHLQQVSQGHKRFAP